MSAQLAEPAPGRATGELQGKSILTRPSNASIPCPRGSSGSACRAAVQRTTKIVSEFTLDPSGAEARPISAPWKPDGTPFFWVPKEALNRIEQGLERGQAASAKLTYMALAWVACSENSDTFAKPISFLARLASLERRTVEKRLPDLERLGLVQIHRTRIEGTKARDIHRYTLLNLFRKVAKLNPNLANAPTVHSFADNRELKNERRKPLTTPERIAREKQLDILKVRLAELEADTAEQWQRDAHPELVTEKQELRAKIKALEDSLLNP